MAKLGKVRVGGNNPVKIMGIINTSKESFYKNSIKTTKQDISNTIKQMELDGADIVDIGGMSTAPYLSTMVSEKIELARISNAIKIVQNVSNIPISIDTCRANIAKSALELGADIINDISGLKYDKKMIEIVSSFNPSLILCAYDNKVVLGNQIKATTSLLKQSTEILKKIEFPMNKVVLDPAIGFFRVSGKGLFFTKIKTDWFKRDLEVIKNLRSIKQQYPILISVSNKSFIGKIIKEEDPSRRLFGSIAAEVISVLNGADVIRTHNVSQTKDAILVASKISSRNKGL